MLLNKRIILFLSDMMSGWRKQASGLVFAHVRARHRDGIVIEHSGYQLHIITDIPPDTVVSELTRLFLDVFADPN